MVLFAAAAQLVVEAAVAGEIGKAVMAVAVPTWTEAQPEVELLSSCTHTAVGMLVIAMENCAPPPVPVTVAVPFIAWVMTGGVEASAVIVAGIRFAVFKTPLRLAVP